MLDPRIVDLNEQFNKLTIEFEKYADNDNTRDFLDLSIWVKIARKFILLIKEKMEKLTNASIKEDAQAIKELITQLDTSFQTSEQLQNISSDGESDMPQDEVIKKLYCCYKDIEKFISELPSKLFVIQKTLERENNLSLTDLLHEYVLRYYQDNLDYYTLQKREDIELIMSALVRPYLNNMALIAEIESLIGKLQSNFLRETFNIILKRHKDNSFKDKYIEKIECTLDSKILKSFQVTQKHHQRFIENFKPKPGGDQKGSIGFKTIIPTENKNKFSKYLNLWLIKQNKDIPNSIPEVRKAQAVRNLYETKGKERYLATSGDMVSKMFERFMTLNDFLMRSYSNQHSLDLDRGLFCGKPVRGLSILLNVINKVTTSDIHLENIGIIDKGDYFLCELIDFEYYGNARFDLSPQKKEDDFKYFNSDENAINILKKMLTFEVKTPDTAVVIDFSSESSLKSSLDKTNPWLWKEVLKNSDKSEKISDVKKQIIADWIINVITSKMKEFPVQRAQALNYFSEHELSLFGNSHIFDMSYRESIQTIFNADIPKSRKYAFNRLSMHG